MGNSFPGVDKQAFENKIVGAIDFYDPIGSGVKYAANASANWARQVLKSLS